MSETLSTARRNVRLALRDTEVNPPVFAGSDVDREILSKAQEIGVAIGQGFDWDTGVVTLTVGSTADYSLGAATTQWERIICARISETGDTLERVSFADINARREGLISTSSGGGDPIAFALWEDSTQIVRMRIDCIPTTARTIDFMRSSLPSATVADSTTLPFSDLGLRAVEKAAASTLAAKCSPTLLEKLGLSPEAASVFRADSDRMVKLECERLARISRKPYGVGAILGR